MYNTKVRLLQTVLGDLKNWYVHFHTFGSRKVYDKQKSINIVPYYLALT